LRAKRKKKGNHRVSTSKSLRRKSAGNSFAKKELVGGNGQGGEGSVDCEDGSPMCIPRERGKGGDEKRRMREMMENHHSAFAKERGIVLSTRNGRDSRDMSWGESHWIAEGLERTWVKTTPQFRGTKDLWLAMGGKGSLEGSRKKWTQ